MSSSSSSSSSTTTSSTTTTSHVMEPVPEADEIGITLNPYLHGRPTPRAVQDLRNPEKTHDISWTSKVLKSMKTIANQLIGAEPDLKSFPGSHVVSLTRKALYDTLAKQSYYVCEKTDGVRYLLLCAQGQCFLIDRKDRYTWVNIFLPRRARPSDAAKGGWPPPNPTLVNNSSRLNNTLLDGELVIDKIKLPNGSISHRLVFYIFDVMAVQQDPSMKPADCSVVSLPLPDRLRLLHSYVLEPRHQFQQAQHLKHLFNNELKQNSIHTPNGRGFDIKPKNMYRAEDTKYVLEVVLPHLPHEQDGLIYTAVNRRYTIGTDHSLIKWKPPYLNSVDFILESIVGANHQKYYYLMVGERNVERHTYEQTRVDWVTVSDKDRSEFNINGRVVVEAVWAKELETIVMKKNEDSGSSKWVPGHTRIGGWKIIRTRPDKKSSNDIRVYKKIKESIRDNVLEHDLIEALGDDGENATGLEPGAKKQRR